MGSIAESFQDKADTLSFEDLKKDISDLEKSLKALEDTKDEGLNDATARVKRSLFALNNERDSRLSKKFFEWMQKNSWAAVIVIVPVLYLGVLRLRPQWLLLLPAEFTIPKTGIKLTPQILLILKYRPRVLDAWVAAHIHSARKGFQKGVAEMVMISRLLFTKELEFQVLHLSDFIMKSATPSKENYGKRSPGNV